MTTRMERWGGGLKTLAEHRAWLLAVGLTLALSGCKDSAIIQKEEVKSPDGRWMARMEVEQFGGLGTAGLQTSVYLLRNVQEKPIEILSFDDESVDTAQVQMAWRDGEHLEVWHSIQSKIEFQVIKCCGGIEIAVH